MYTKFIHFYTNNMCSENFLNRSLCVYIFFFLLNTSLLLLFVGYDIVFYWIFVCGTCVTKNTRVYEERRWQFAAFAFSYRKRLEDVTSGKRPDRYAREWRGREKERVSLALAPALKPRQTLDSREREIRGTLTMKGTVAIFRIFLRSSIYFTKYIERLTNSC